MYLEFGTVGNIGSPYTTPHNKYIISEDSNHMARSISTSSTLQAMSSFCRAMNPNNPAASRVGAGLMALTSVSKAIGKGGKLPVSIDSLGSNTKWVLGALGIDSQSLFQPARPGSACGGADGGKGIVKEGMGMVDQLFNKIKNADFKINDIPIFKPPLENLYNLQKCKATFNADQLDPRELDQRVTPYAVALDKALPKQKFTFVVEFMFNAPYMQDTNFMRYLSFVVKKASRPAAKYKTEDVNYYNFRTHVVTKAEWDDISLTMYDDRKNAAHALYTAYMQAMSPITNAVNNVETINFEKYGMLNNTAGDKVRVRSALFDEVAVSAKNSGSTGPLANNAKTIIQSIKLHHIYDNGKLVNTYTFHNPRITSMDLDDLDMSSSEINTVDIKFVYESMHSQLTQPLSGALLATITALSGAYGDIYALHYKGEAVDRNGTPTYGGANERQQKNGCIGDTMSMVSNLGNTIGGLFK